jgi:hypothetical protein
MGIIAWIVLGLAAGLLANMLILSLASVMLVAENASERSHDRGRRQSPAKDQRALSSLVSSASPGRWAGVGSPPSCSTSTPCRASSTCPPGSPPSPALPSCCSPTTCSRRGPRGPGGPVAAAVTRTAEPGCCGFAGQLPPGRGSVLTARRRGHPDPDGRPA